MPGAPPPPNLLEAIASSAGGGFITNPIPETPTGTNAASIQGGFPPVTMQEEIAGGEPPLGQDINGYLFLLSSHTLWVECGQTYQYNATLAAAIGGYATGTILGMADGTGLWLNLGSGNTTNPDTGGPNWVPIAAYGSATIATTGGTVTLTHQQAKYGVIILTGALTQNLAVNFPPTIQEWLVINNTTGAFVTTLRTSVLSSVGVTSPQGGFGSPLGVYSVGDGNIYPTVAPLGVPIDQNPTPLTLVERTNAGYVLATFFNMSAPADNFPIGNVMYERSTGGGDGFIRKISLTNFEAQVLLQGLGGQVVNGQVPFSVVSQWASALFSSPAFTGVPTAPTAAPGTSTTQIATTAYASPTLTVTSNGICITFPNGAKLQAGTVNPAGGSAVATFPVPFTTYVFVVPTSVAGAAVQTWLSALPSLTDVTIHNSGGSSIWIAVGL